jgi:hypothetical protein
MVGLSVRTLASRRLVSPQERLVATSAAPHFVYTPGRVNLKEEGRTWRVSIGRNALSWKAYRGD